MEDFKVKKAKGEKISMLTAYDYPTAVYLDRAGIDLILVGDSLANAVLGLESTTQVDMAVMLHHTRAVCRGAKQVPVLADMPFAAYQIKSGDTASTQVPVSLEESVRNARQLIDAGCIAVKVEWFDRCVEVVQALRQAGIAVMGHVGLTPQTAQSLGGFKVQGKDGVAAAKIKEEARALEKAGCFAIVLECVPESLAQEITAALKIPTIGIGAGKFCDGQVLVLNDMLGLNAGKVPKFVKKYADMGTAIETAAKLYREEVSQGQFPGPEQTFH